MVSVSAGNLTHHEGLGHEVLLARRPVVQLTVLAEAQQQRVHHHLQTAFPSFVSEHTPKHESVRDTRVAWRVFAAKSDRS